MSGSVLETNPGVLENELESCRGILSAGVLAYKPNTQNTAKAFSSSKEVPESWKGFVSKVSTTLGLEELAAWQLICSYLSTEFRGTQQSLKDLINDDQKRKPLILDVWQFYRAERLYLLQIIKQIISLNHDTQSNPQLAKAMKTLDSGSGLHKSLSDQLSAVTKEKAPDTEALGPSLGNTCRSAWIHFNLRETSELLQILLISLHVRGFQFSHIVDITQILFQFGFGAKLPFKSEYDEKNNTLQRSIGLLCICILVYMLDLSSLSTSVEDHKIWGNPDSVAKVERLVSGLGNQPCHAPALLAWTLGCFLARGAEGLNKAASRMGEMALANRVLKTLENILTADFNSHKMVSDIVHLEVYTVVSALLAAFDPVSMGLQTDLETLTIILLKHRSVATHFWKQGSDSGLAFFFQETITNFPCDFVPVVEYLTSLASASPASSRNVVATLSNLPVYTEHVDRIQSRIGRSLDGSIEILEDRYPYQSTKTICIPANTKGDLTENNSVRWQLQQNGWQILLAECGQLSLEVSCGEEQVRGQTLNRVTKLSGLVSSIITSCPELSGKLEEITSELTVICSRFCQVTHPPLQLLAQITQIFASISKASKLNGKVIDALEPTGLLPRFSLSYSLLEKSSPSLVPGVVGLLLAGEETVSGEYPLLLAFLKLVKECAGHEKMRAGILFVCREVLPSYSNWRYQNPGEREQILKLSLSILLEYIIEVKEGGEIVAKEHGVCGSLLFLVSTGDRTLQSLLESQVSWETGRGTDFCEIVDTALCLLDRLLRSSASDQVLAGPVGGALRAPPSGPQSHLILSLAHYSYFFHDPVVATGAISLLATIAAAVARANDSVSLLACLGSSAVSVKDLLLARLESPLEDIRLKIAIINLLSQCVKSQPGMIQLLLDVNINLTVVEGGTGSAEASKAQSESELVGEGCLSPAMQLLAQCKDNKDPNWQKLHLALVKLVYNLWDTVSLLATRHLKEEPGFWESLCWPIFHPIKDADSRHIKAKAYILRILASEIYTWKGKVSPQLSKVLEKICDEQSSCISTWCQGITNTKFQEKTLADDSEEEEEEGDDEDSEDSANKVEMFLISSWRIFLLVLSKDYPVSVCPAACRLTFMATVNKLIDILREEPPPIRLTVLLAETGTVLIKRWQTKCTDNMEALCKHISGILEVLHCTWSSLHPRARLSILALALSILRVSQFKLDQQQELQILRGWLNPVVKVLALSFRQIEQSIPLKNSTSGVSEAPELTLSLLQTLISRCTQDKAWLTELHSEATLQLLLSACGNCCRHKAAPSFVRRILQLLVEVAASASGSASLLVHDLAREVWLPLSDLPAGDEWEEVGLLGLQLATTLLRTGRTHALNTAVTAAALLCDKLVIDLMKPRTTLAGLPNAVCVARFIGLLSGHIATWRSEHQPSLQAIYRCCCSLLHYCTALLMRPTVLVSMVKMSTGTAVDEDAHRCRRMSTASSCGEMDAAAEAAMPMEAVPAHTHLVDISLSCLSLLLALSPGLPSLLTGAALVDPDRYEPLLVASFANPTLEEQQLQQPQQHQQLSYGTLLALANTSVRSITRDHARSPSPGRVGASGCAMRSTKSPSTNDTAEKRRLTLLMERSVVLVLCQSILTLSQNCLSARDKQLLRRELGAELGSITDTWRRYCARGCAKSPATSRSARSPGPSTSSGRTTTVTPPPPTSPQPAKKTTSSSSDDQFMKFITNLVGNVFK